MVGKLVTAHNLEFPQPAVNKALLPKQMGESCKYSCQTRTVLTVVVFAAASSSPSAHSHKPALQQKGNMGKTAPGPSSNAEVVTAAELHHLFSGGPSCHPPPSGRTQHMQQTLASPGPGRAWSGACCWSARGASSTSRPSSSCTPWLQAEAAEGLFSFCLQQKAEKRQRGSCHNAHRA